VRMKTFLTAIVAALGIAPGAYAQGCALCYTTASATSTAAQHSLRLGIFTLLIPALALFLGVFILLYRRAIAAAA
jgi:hypothetical protein